MAAIPNKAELRKAAEAAADEKGMCECRCLIKGMMDNGNTYNVDDILHMHKALIPAHVHQGLVELVTPGGAKQAKTPANKQVTSSQDK